MRAIAIVVALAAPVHADDHIDATAPPPVARPTSPLAIAEGAIRLDTTFETEMSSDRVGKPMSVAPDLWYGASDALMFGVVHSKAATTGFRGSAGGGFCIRTQPNGCAHVYNNVGAEAWHVVTGGSLAVSAGGGFYATNIASDFYAFKLGGKLRYGHGRLFATTFPSVFMASTKRDANKDMLYAPVALGGKLTSTVALAIGSGVKGPLEGLSHGWQVPLGLVATYTVGPELSFGASWVYGQLASAATNPAPPAAVVEGMELRVVQVWASITR